MQAIGHGGPRTQAGLEWPAPVIVLEALARFVSPEIIRSVVIQAGRKSHKDQTSAGHGGRLAGHRHRDPDRPGHTGHLVTSRWHPAVLVFGAGRQPSPVQVGPFSSAHPVGGLRHAATCQQACLCS